MPADQLSQFLLALCKNQPVAAFGALVYDERTAELRKLLSDQDYWDALDKASGPDFEVFALRDEEGFQADRAIELLTAASLSRSRSRGKYFSRLLRDYFGEDETRLAYPSFLLFVMGESKIAYCRLIPFQRGTIDETFHRLQGLVTVIAKGISQWKSSGSTSVSDLWDVLKHKLLERDYTVYIQQAPRETAAAVAALRPFIEQPHDD